MSSTSTPARLKLTVKNQPRETFGIEGMRRITITIILEDVLRLARNHCIIMPTFIAPARRVIANFVTIVVHRCMSTCVIILQKEVGTGLHAPTLA